MDTTVKTHGEDMLTCPHLTASLHLHTPHCHAPHPLHKPFHWPSLPHASAPCCRVPCGCVHHIALPLAAACITSLCPSLHTSFPIVPSLIFSHELRPHKVSNEFQPNKEPTIGAAFLTQKCRLEDRVLRYEIW